MVLSGLVDPPGSSALPAFDLPPMSSSWTGAPCSPQRTPGFPVELPGVDELHAAFLNESRTRTRRWRPVQEIRDHGPKKSGRSPFQRSCDAGKKTAPRAKMLVHGVKAFEKKPVLGPCTLVRTWGTRPGRRASFFALSATPPMDYIWVRCALRP
jgi:hypothetical protein